MQGGAGKAKESDIIERVNPFKWSKGQDVKEDTITVGKKSS